VGKLINLPRDFACTSILTEDLLARLWLETTTWNGTVEHMTGTLQDVAYHYQKLLCAAVIDEISSMVCP
jgi:hypothetical protein